VRGIAKPECTSSRSEAGRIGAARHGGRLKYLYVFRRPAAASIYPPGMQRGLLHEIAAAVPIFWTVYPQWIPFNQAFETSSLCAVFPRNNLSRIKSAASLARSPVSPVGPTQDGHPFSQEQLAMSSWVRAIRMS
jgi:hypothetical protein